MEKVQPFPNAASRTAFAELAMRLRGGDEPVPPTASQKIGLYPLVEDVIVSRPLFQIILLALERGSETDRVRVAEMMRLAAVAPYTM